jgi:Uma2 family endonuclease
MSTTLAPPPPRLITVEEYARQADDGRKTELVRGRIVEVPQPKPLHGYLCGRVSRMLGNFVEDRGLGRVLTNDAGIVTECNPDTVRGADVAYYSYQRLPKGPLPKSYLEVAPELAIEIRSPDDRWKDIRKKVAEYLTIGVTTVVVIDLEPKKVHVYSADREDEALSGDDVLQLPDVLPGFSLPLPQILSEA